MKQFCLHATSILNFIFVADSLITDIFPIKTLSKMYLDGGECKTSKLFYCMFEN